MYYDTDVINLDVDAGGAISDHRDWNRRYSIANILYAYGQLDERLICREVRSAGQP